MTAIMLFHNLNKATMSVDWLGLHIECKMPHRNSKRDKAKLDYRLSVLIEEIDGHPAGAAILPADREDPLGSFLRISLALAVRELLPESSKGFPFLDSGCQ